MFFAPMFGMLNDKKLVDRRYLICGAIVFWSLATSLAGFAQNLTALVLIRSLVGVGEAAYTTIAPPMLFDFYPYQERAIIMGIYFLAVPIGGTFLCITSSNSGYLKQTRHLTIISNNLFFLTCFTTYTAVGARRVGVRGGQWHRRGLWLARGVLRHRHSRYRSCYVRVAAAEPTHGCE